MLTNEDKIFKRWAEDIEQLHTDKKDDQTTEIENSTETKITEEEITDKIRKIPRQKRVDTDKIM